MTDSTGNTVEVSDFYPYGEARISTGTFTEQRQFAGTERDRRTGLDYMQARYYRTNQGQFISEDPSHLTSGVQSEIVLRAV
jgi:RHS repeat-associated protein